MQYCIKLKQIYDLRNCLVFFKNVSFHCWHCTSAWREEKQTSPYYIYILMTSWFLNLVQPSFSKSPWYSWNIVESDVKQHNPNTPFKKERWCWILPVLYGYSWYILSSQRACLMWGIIIMLPLSLLSLFPKPFDFDI